MNETRLLQIDMLFLLWVIPLLLGAYLYAAHRRGRALERFAEADLLKQINTAVVTGRRRWKAALVLVAFGCVVVGLARPAWNPRGAGNRTARAGRRVPSRCLEEHAG